MAGRVPAIIVLRTRPPAAQGLPQEQPGSRDRGVSPAGTRQNAAFLDTIREPVQRESGVSSRRLGPR